MLNMLPHMLKYYKSPYMNGSMHKDFALKESLDMLQSLVEG